MTSKIRTRKIRICVLICQTMSLGLATPVFAQPSRSTTDVQDEIIVTATKRAQNVLDVPISLQVIDSEQIAAFQSHDLSELSAFVPNMFEPPSVEGGRNIITMRGIGAGINRSAGRAVGVYVDGVYVSAETALDVMLEDVRQVEVLRGPQGTLFGRNTIGGAINITTHNPDLESDGIGGQARLGPGSLSRRSVAGHINVPLIKRELAFRISGHHLERDGYVRNLFDGSRLADKNRGGFSLSALWQPQDAVSLSAKYTWFRRDEHPNSEGETITNIGADQIPYTVNLDTPERQKQTGRQASLRLDYQTAGGFTLTSISAWSDVNDYYIQDGDRLPQAITINRFDGANEEISQEFRLASPTTEKGDFLFGLYYLDNRSLYSPTFPLMGQAFLEQVFFLPPDLHPPDTLDGQRIVGRDKTLAVFAHGNYNIDENVSLFGGLRLTRDEKTVDYAIFGETFALFGLSPLQHHQKLTYTPLSWSIGARTRATDNLSAYAKISRGYRSATIKDDFIGQADLAAPTGFFTKPEFLTNYELGFKFHRPKSGLRLNASAFYMDYQDIQVSISQEPFLFLRTLTNAAKAHIVGFEADMDWQFAPNWRVSGGAGYIKTRYDWFEPEPGRDLSGTGFGTAPKWTFNGALDYEHADRHGRWQAHIDGHYLIAPDDFVLRTLPFVGQYPVFNGWIGFAPKNRAWQIRLWVKNLGNTHRPKTNFHWGAGLGPLLDNITVQYEPPRRYGLSLSVPFGR